MEEFKNEGLKLTNSKQSILLNQNNADDRKGGDLLERLVGPGREVKVIPADAPVGGADKQVVAAGMHRDRGDPLRRTQQLLHQLLLLQVVDAHVSLGRHEEERTTRMESDI